MRSMHEFGSSCQNGTTRVARPGIRDDRPPNSSLSFATRALGLPAVVLFAAALHGLSSAAVINVPSPQAPTITVAINIASSGDEIVVAPGTYFESVSLNGKTLTIRSSEGPEVTVIDGLGQFQSVVRIISGEGPATLIEGFTIRNGVATAPAPGNRGGAIYCNLTSPTIRNCILVNNTAGIGGAFYSNGGSPKILECTFIDNQTVSSGDGGAILANNSIVTLTDCEFVGNSSARHGGAIQGNGSTRMDVVRCEFVANVANNNGGAIDIGSGGAAYLFQACRFIANTSGALGGAVQVASATGTNQVFINCLFRSNQGGTNGGALNVAGRVELTNCTVVNNAASGNGGALVTSGSAVGVIRNSIIWGNVPNGLAGLNVTATYSCVQATVTGVGNIFSDPLFVDDANGDHRLTEASPCIDAGDTNLLGSFVALDLGGRPRVVNLRELPTGMPAFGYFVDMGAFEFPAAPPVPSCPGDINGDGVVDGADLGALLNAWGICRP